MKLRQIIPVLVGIGSLIVTGHAASTIVSVDSTAGPWDFASGGLNTGNQYGVHDFSAPVVISSGFDFTAGGSFTITALVGLTSPFGGVPYATAEGDVSYQADATGGSSGAGFPSLYIDPAEYPANLNELVGTFTDSSGAIVGVPFNIGLARTITVPAGAEQLQLGLNDDIFNDNTGSLRVSVSGPGRTVPEASSTLILLGVGCAGMAGLARRRFMPV